MTTRPTCSRRCGRLATRYLKGDVRDTNFCEKCSPTQVKDVQRLRPIAEKFGEAPPREAEPRIRATPAGILTMLDRFRDELVETLGSTTYDENGVKALLARLNATTLDGAIANLNHLERTLDERRDLVITLEKLHEEAKKALADERRQHDKLRADRDAALGQVKDLTDANAQLRADLEVAEQTANEALDALPAKRQQMIAELVDSDEAAANMGAPSRPAPAAPATAAEMPIHRQERMRQAQEDSGRAPAILQAYVHHVTKELANATPRTIAPTVTVGTRAEKDFRGLPEQQREKVWAGIRKWLSGDAAYSPKKRSGNSRGPKATSPHSYALHCGRQWVCLEKGLAAASYTITHIESDH